jgi:glycosyltransferase involved in cell wall biosynthesis
MAAAFCRVLLVIVLNLNSFVHAADVTVVGYIKHANGLGRVTMTWVDVLSRELDVHFVDTRPNFTSFEDVPQRIMNVCKQKSEPAHIALLTDNIWIPNHAIYTTMPNTSIKIAYSMCESTKIPQPWVTALNQTFDAVVVPDPYLIQVYKSSGVTIPIFMIPIALYLQDFLKAPLKKDAHKPFAFGVSAALSKNKNISLLVTAFAKEFGNRPDVVLKIHTPWAGNVEEIKSLIRKLNVKNIHIAVEALPWAKYVEFMKSLDCYVLLSRGEGFSITVREAMSLGLPCIISNNTAHKTICDTNLVYGVPSIIERKSDSEFYKVDVGNNFDCYEADVRTALKVVMKQYQKNLKTASARRDWAKHYVPENMAPFYVNLVKPRKVVLGTDNEITSEYLMTNSKTLYKKYVALQKRQRNT